MLIPAAALVLALAASGIGEPEARKVHLPPIPRLGGVAIAGAFYVGIAAGLVAARATGDSLNLETGHLPGLLVGVALIAGVGLLDDLQGMRARVQVLAQVV